MIAITLVSIVYQLVHWLSSKWILGVNPVRLPIFCFVIKFSEFFDSLLWKLIDKKISEDVVSYDIVL